jgi:hypothetical protein
MNSVKNIRNELKKIETELKSIKKLENELKKVKDPNTAKATKTATNTTKQIEKCKSKKALEKFTKDDLVKFVKSHKLKVSDCKKKLIKTVWEFIDESDSESEWEYYYSTESDDSESSDDDSSSDDE